MIFWICAGFAVLGIVYIAVMLAMKRIKKMQDKSGKPPDDRYPMW